VIRLTLNLRRGTSTMRFGEAPAWSLFGRNHGLSEFVGENASPTVTPTKAAAICSGKRVICLWHGYRVEDPTNAYLQILARLEGLYDVAILGWWPGSDWLLGFWFAGRRADEAGRRAAAALAPIAALASAFDIEGHSLGCRVTMEALGNGLTVRNAILAAPAIDNESLQQGERYGYAVCRARRVLVAHSERDDVLREMYLIGKQDRALGLRGAQDRAWCAPNISFVDCSATAGGHSAYKSDPTFFAAWEEMLR